MKKLVVVDAGSIIPSCILGGEDHLYVDGDKLINIYTLNSLKRLANALNVIKFERGITDDDMDVVIAYDSRSWRYDFFPNYKSNRSKTDTMPNGIKIKDYIVYIEKVMDKMKTVSELIHVRVNKAEADDILYVLSKYSENDEVILVSNDKDIKQCAYNNDRVSLYNIQYETFIECGVDDILEHIIKGDSGDGIPSVLCDDDHYVKPDSKRKPVNKNRLNAIKSFILVGEFDENVLGKVTNSNDLAKNIKRNKKLINFADIDSDYVDSIRGEFFEATERKNQTEIFDKMNISETIGILEG